MKINFKNLLGVRSKWLLILLIAILFGLSSNAQKNDKEIYGLSKDVKLFSLPLDTVMLKLENGRNTKNGNIDSRIKSDIKTTLELGKPSKKPLLMVKANQAMATWHYQSIKSEKKDSIYYYDNEAFKYLLKTKDKVLIYKKYRTLGRYAKIC